VHVPLSDVNSLPEPWRFARRAGAVVAAIFLMFIVCVVNAPAQTDLPRFTNRSFVGDAFALEFMPNTTAWTSVETSADDSTWKFLASVATTNSTTIYVDEDASRASGRFYRLRQPGVSVEDSEAKWSLGPTNYTFQLQRARLGSNSGTLSGTVTVRDGQKLVTNAFLNGDPISQPDPNDFPTISELFSILKEAQQTGCWRVSAAYDEARGFPARCVVERLTQSIPAAKQVDQYWVTGLTPLVPND
jgi:hypothetical protein